MREEDFGERRGGYAGEGGDCVGAHFVHSNSVNMRVCTRGCRVVVSSGDVVGQEG
jgi:hypothetical protein